ncbi:retrotransposon Gag-like protein 6 [Lates japonicus]|uniref:Retrotransposon Gag-like protein 6 n=1 Tax=Lates japonicus TaxID=270547 RepID=A0AAD3ME36_LATJO|nr:retrotransposon Gag-like protein 6 [Lates japonicus]
MDSTDSDPLRSALRAQGQQILHQEEQLALHQEMREMTERQGQMLSALGSQLNLLVDHVQHGPLSSDSPGSAPPLTTQDAEPQPSLWPPGFGLNSHIHLSSLVKFSGDSGDCHSFLAQCELHFEFQAASFSMDRAKIAYMISHMSCRAETWATAEWSRCSAISLSCPQINFESSRTPPGSSETPIVPLGEPMQVGALLSRNVSVAWMRVVASTVHRRVTSSPTVLSNVVELLEVVRACVHSEKISFHLVNAPRNPLLLGLPWLKTHNPHIDWSSGQILSWSDACHHHCVSKKQVLPIPVTVTKETRSLPVDPEQGCTLQQGTSGAPFAVLHNRDFSLLFTTKPPD